MGVVAKRSSMTFYSDGTSHYSHRVRIVLAEKGVTVETIDVDPDNKPEDLASLNPYNNLPTLVDRDLVLYEADIMMEYLDERFPHPPLFPVYPVARAQSRLWIYRIRQDWCELVDSLMAGDGTPSQLEKKRKELRESLISIAPIFGEKPYFMSDEFTLVDCYMSAILYRLPYLGVTTPNSKSFESLRKYQEKLFSRPSFDLSLTDAERDLKYSFN